MMKSEICKYWTERTEFSKKLENYLSRQENLKNSYVVSIDAEDIGQQKGKLSSFVRTHRHLYSIFGGNGMMIEERKKMKRSEDHN